MDRLSNTSVLAGSPLRFGIPFLRVLLGVCLVIAGLPFAGVDRASAAPDPLAAQSTQASTTLLLSIQQDTYLDWGASAQNFGSSSELPAKIPSGNDGTRPVLQFNLAQIPAQAQVLSATAYFYTIQSSAQPLSLHRVTSAWAENTATWASLATAYDPTVAGSLAPNTANQFAGADVTALVQQWVTNSAPNYGMILVPTTLNSESRFASQERSSTAQRPYLEVVIATSSISLDAQKDTWIYKKADAKNYGTCSSFKLDTSGGDIGEGRSLLQFDLSTLPNPINIVTAYLELTKTGGDTATHDIRVYPVLATWDEGSGGCGGTTGEASWKKRQPSTNWNTEGGDYAPIHLAATDVSAHGLYTWDVTTLVALWRSGFLSNRGVLLATPDTGTHLYEFGSRENANPTLRPRLVIKYATTTGTIAGRVWDDVNRNGVPESGEGGLAQVSMDLYPGVCGAAPIAPSQRVLTGADGSYGFTGLASGAYCVRVDEDGLPSAFGTVDDKNPVDLTLDLATTSTILDLNFAYASTLAPDRLTIGTYAPCTDYAWLQTLATTYGATIATADTSACAFTLSVPAANLDALSAAAGAEIKSRFGRPDSLAHSTFVPNDPDYNNVSIVYGPQQINAPVAWDTTLGDPNLILAVIDTGLDLTHPEFAGRLVPGYDFVNKDADPTDDNGHGTHVAAIAAGAINNAFGMAGMAGQVKIMPIKVLNASNVGWMSDVAAGITFAVDNGAKVINLSLAATTESLAVRDAITYAVSKGVVVIAAAGNDNSAVARYPAFYDNVIAVGATTYTSVRWSLSNYGPNLDVVAPGALVWSAARGGGFQFMSGTSMAAPHTAGLAALLLSVNPNLTPTQIKTAMQTTATDMGAAGVDTLYGYGQINAGAALASIPPAAFAPPVTSLAAVLVNDLNGNGLVDPGDTVRYRVVAANGNPAPLAGVVISGNLPASVTYVAGSTALNGIPVLDSADISAPAPLEAGGLDIGSIPANNSNTIAFDVVVGSLPKGIYSLAVQVTVTTDSGAETLSTETELAGTLLRAQVDPLAAQAGDSLTFGLTTDYVGADLLQNVVITAPIPAGTAYVPGSANSGGSESGGVVTWNLGGNVTGVPNVINTSGGALAKTYRDDFGSAATIDVHSGESWAGNLGSENWTNAWANGSTPFKSVVVDNGSMSIKTHNQPGQESVYRNVNLNGATTGDVVVYLSENGLNSANQIKLQACTGSGGSCQDLGNLGAGTTGKLTFSLDAALAAITVGRIQFVQPVANTDADDSIILSSFEVRTGSGKFSTYRDDFGAAVAVDVDNGESWAGNLGSENWTNAWANGSTLFKSVVVDNGSMIIKTNNQSGQETVYRDINLSGAITGDVVVYLVENGLNSADQIKLQACTSFGDRCQDLGNLGAGTTGKLTFSLNAALAAITVGRIQFIQPVTNTDADDSILLSSVEMRFVIDMGVKGMALTAMPALVTAGSPITVTQVLTYSDRPGPTGTVDVRIAVSSDDAEEAGPDATGSYSSGSLDFTSSDLELSSDFDTSGGYSGGTQKIGLRFNTLTVPQGAIISNAYITFQATVADSPNTNSNSASLTIHGQAADNPGTFTTAGNPNFDISNRPRTLASVGWGPEGWTAGESYNTPNLAAMVQEIVNRAGWASGNSMAFIISGTGSRSAASYDGDSAAAPLLHIEWQLAPAPILLDPLVITGTNGVSATLISGPNLVTKPAPTRTLIAPTAINYTTLPSQADTEYMTVTHVIDGSGLSASPTITNYLNITHTRATSLTVWTTVDPGALLGDFFAEGGQPQSFTLDLGGLYAVEGIVNWPYIAGPVGDIHPQGNAASAAYLDFSTDGGATFSSMVKVTLPLNMVDEGLPLETTFAPKNANFVRMTIMDNHYPLNDGGDRVGLAEVRFTGTPVNQTDTYTWIYQATAGDNGGHLIFSGSATDGTYTWPSAQSNSVMAAPPLTFQATVNNPATTANVQAIAFIADSGDLLPSHASNTTLTTLPASVGGRVWNDQDGDAIQDAGEASIDNVTVRLTNSQGDTVTQVVDGDGRYIFTGLSAGVYSVTVDVATVPALYEFMTTHLPTEISLSNGQAVTTAAFGFKARSSSIGDTLYYDANADGVQGPGEPGLGNISLELYLDDGDGVFEPVPALGSDTYMGTTVSNAAGAYRLDAPVAGSYFVDVTDERGLLAGLAHTVGSQSVTDPSPAIPVAVGQTVQSVDFGYVRLPAAGHAILGDQVWVDENGDGFRQLSEPVVIDTQICATPNVGGAPLCAQTDINGRYLLELPVGGYAVAPTTLPLSLTVTTPSPLAVVLADGEQDLSGDFGFGGTAATLGSIGGQIWQDLPVNDLVDGVFNPATEPGLPNVSVDLVLDRNSDGIWDSGDVYVATLSDMGGIFRFKGLLAGAYLAQVSDTLHVLRRFAPTIAPTTGSAPGDNINKPQPYAVVLAAGEANSLADFGYREYDAFGASSSLQPGMIGDQLWHDADGNGLYDQAAGDQPLSGVTLEARSAGVVVATATTGSDGKYLLMDLPLGRAYDVTVTDLFGVLEKYQPSALGSTGQNNQNQAQPYATFLALASTDLKADFGFARLTSVGDRVWWDANQNGVQDADEPGIPNVPLDLVDATDTVIRSMPTNGLGNYGFKDLPKGAYTVTVNGAAFLPGGSLAGWTASPKAATVDSLDSDGDPDTHRAAAAPGFGRQLSTVDFGFDATSAAQVSISTPSFVRFGDDFQVTITITNTGNTWISQVPVSLDFDPNYMVLRTASPVADALPNSGVITWTDGLAGSGGGGLAPTAAGELAPGEATQLLVTFGGTGDSTGLPGETTPLTVTLMGGSADPDGPTGAITPLAVVGQSASNGGVIIVNPTGVNVVEMGVQAAADGVHLSWRTVDESRVAGFYIWRQTGEQAPERITDQPLLAHFGGQPTGETYTFIDPVQPNGVTVYEVEILLSNGGTLRLLLGRTGGDFTIFMPLVSR